MDGIILSDVRLQILSVCKNKIVRNYSVRENKVRYFVQFVFFAWKFRGLLLSFIKSKY